MKITFTVILLFFTSTVLVFFYLHSLDNKSIPNTQFSEIEQKKSLLFDEEDKNKLHEYYPSTDDIHSDGINVEKEILRKFADAFVEVQAYLTAAGNNANYQESTLIVKRHGLSVETYTEIAKQMNENPSFQKIIQDFMNKPK